MNFPFPPDEPARLAALRRYEILDTPPAEAFDRITRTASQVLGVPIALISLIDSDRQWLKSCVGLDVSETPRDVAFCAHTILSHEVMIVPDATLDPRFAENPLVTGSPGIRFYAGAPLKTRDGFNLGTLCVIDTQPRGLSTAEQSLLTDLAAIVVDQLELLCTERRLRGELEERDRTEILLEASETKFRSVAQSVGDAIISADAASAIIFWNAAAETIFGYSETEMLGRPLTQIMPERFREQHRAGMARYLASGTAQVIGKTLELTGLHRRGHEFPIELSISTWQTQGGVFFTGIVRDISERLRLLENAREAAIEREVAAAQRASAERYAFLADAVPQIIWTAKPDGSVDYFNKAWCEYTGFTFEQSLDWSWRPVLHPDDFQRCTDRWTEALRSGQNYEIEYRFRRAADGAYRWHLGRGQPMKNEAGEIVHWVGTCTDIDDAKRAGERLQAANDALNRRVTERTAELHSAKEVAEAASRAKSEFLANMSHEIRTPMNGILGMTELALETALSHEQREYLNMAKSAGRALLGVVNDILDFSKIEAGKLEFEHLSFDLRQTISETLEPFVLRARQAQLALAVTIAPEVPAQLAGDPLRLRQVLSNFLDNALKFTPRGSFGLEVTMAAEAPSECWLRFSVWDTGIGIAEEKQKVIFEAFAQVDSSTTRHYGGTGLGLAIAARLIHGMRGKVWVESVVGKGTTFHFTARFGLDETALTSPAATPAAPASSLPLFNLRRGLRILLAEDNEINRLLTSGLLTKRGHTVIQAANGSQAVAAACESSFDLIFMDLQMPDLDGFQATEKIRAHERTTGSRTPIIALTAHALSSDRERCLRAGMDDYASKPIVPERLLALLEKWSSEDVFHIPAPPPEPPAGGLARTPHSRAELLRYLDDDEELLRRLAALFCQKAPQLLDATRRAIGNREAAALAAHAHSLASSLGAFGAAAASRLAQDLEVHAADQDHAHKERTFDALAREIALLQTVLLAEAPPK